jgi:hypothetical protein
MKSTSITFISIGLLILLLIATNPSIEVHRKAVMETLREKINQRLSNSSVSNSDNNLVNAAEEIGLEIGQSMVERTVSRSNYILFSLTKLTFGDNVRNIGFGILGTVFVNDIDYEKEIISNKNKSINELNNTSDVMTLDNKEEKKYLTESIGEILQQEKGRIQIKEVQLEEIIEKLPGKVDLNDNKIYSVVDVKPEYPGGISQWTRYITREIERNVEEIEADGKSGTVVVKLIVEKDGTPTEVKVLSCNEAGVANCIGPNSKLAEVAINAIKKGPKWNPAILNEFRVKAHHLQPVTFRIN